MREEMERKKSGKGGQSEEFKTKGGREKKKKYWKMKMEKRKTIRERVAVPLHWVSTTHKHCSLQDLDPERWLEKEVS